MYVPVTHLDLVKNAMFNAGAGKIGNYERCCWQVLGEGQFCPRSDASPYIGRVGILERVDEYRVEMVCEDHLYEKVLSALQDAHPYEEPAFDAIRLL